MTDDHPQTTTVAVEKPRRRSHSKSPKHTQVLVPNTTGRIMFFSIALLLLVCVTLGIVTMTQGGGGWHLKVAVGLLVLGALLTTFAATSASLFRFHRLNFLIFFVLAILIIVMEWLMSRAESEVSVTMAHAGNILGALILLLAGLLLLIPSTVAATKSFHPFIIGGKRRKSSSPSNKKTVKEVHSVFEDWPAPIPFPVTTLYTFAPTTPSELGFSKGQGLMVLDCRGNWWQAKDPSTGNIGFIPSNFVQVLQKARVIKRYLATSDDEASIQENQVVEVMEHHEFLSLVRTVEGRIGSVPTACLELIPDVALEKLKI